MDKNGKPIKKGDIVKIEGGYFKADNGLFRVAHAPGDADWLGKDWSLRKLNKDGTDSKSKHNVAFWPLMVTVNSSQKCREAKRHNAEYATIEVIKQANPEPAEAQENHLAKNPSVTPAINETLAKRAKENMSFSDYKTGSATAEYNAMIAEVREAIETAKAKVSEEAQEKLDRLLESYKRRLANWINKRNANGAGHVSVMIAGPSNYNIRKHNKYVAREDKLWQEYDDIKDINARIQSIVAGDKIIKSNDSEAIDKLKEKLEKALEEHNGYKEYNKMARKEGKDPLPAYVLSNSNGRIKNIRDRIKRLEAIAEQEPEEKEVNGIRIVDNPEAHRLQMFFDGKPDKPTRQLLKSNGFRWTPSIEAWQCYRNPGAMAKAEKLAEAASY